jgi:glucose/arabinose dehydrogenase
MSRRNSLTLLVTLLLFASCSSQKKAREAAAHYKKTSPSDTLAAPYATKSSMNFSNVVGWKDAMPKAPAGFNVTIYADAFQNPRWLYVSPNGDILVAESNSNHPLLERIGALFIGATKSNSMKHSADRITLLRDANHDGVPEVRETFLSHLNQPFGMLVLGNWFYVANTDGLWRFPYTPGQTKIPEKGNKIVDLPAGKHNRHWTRNLIANAEGSKIYIAVGSGSNVAEHGIANELLRADILEINPDGTDLRVYASGLRNPVGMGWAVGTKTLWTVVNERDELGDELVPDYFTHVEEEGFYGWPYVYYGQHEDPRVKDKPVMAKAALVPDINLHPHTASLGLAFYTQKAFPEKYHNGAFIAQHGSWNRSTLSGYKVLFVPFQNGKPSGKPEDFLTGFIVDLEKEKVHGRPVGIVVLPDGSLLIADDVTNTIWQVRYAAK